MLTTDIQIAPARAQALIAAAEHAARAIPPAFPLEATVAVNPFLGQSDEDLAVAGARLARVAGVALTRPRAAYAADMAAGRMVDTDLREALAACTSPHKPRDVAALKARIAMPSPIAAALPTMSHIVAESSGVDWPAIIERTLGLWAAGHFDRGQALWSPAPGQAAYTAWRAWAARDLTPEIAGLAGFCQHVASAPDTTERALLRAAERLDLSPEAAPTVFHRLLIDCGGWAQHARWLLWQAEMEGRTDSTLTDLLAIRLVWEEALLTHLPSVAARWRATLQAHEIPVQPSEDQIIDAILQGAAEHAYQRRLGEALNGPRRAQGRPELQAVFCIDVRSEVFRRALEAQAPDIATLGFAGFFGLPIAHTGHASDTVESHLPVLLKPALASTCHAAPVAEERARIRARAARAWGRFRQAAVSSFAFIEAAGPFYMAKLVRDALGLPGEPDRGGVPRLVNDLGAEGKAQLGATVLKAMGLTGGFARTVLLLGHGAQVKNNPHESAYHCGACGGHTGEVSAWLLAQLLNSAETRAGLDGHGIDIPADTLFVAGLHDTTTDDVTLYAEDVPADRARDLRQVRAWLRAAGQQARAERALRLPGAAATTVAARAANWAEVRPEWGLAGCAAFIAAPRAVTAGMDLGGRAFLHSYDWQADQDFGTLELILTAPVVVASWISLQYYGSAIAPTVFGGGNKLIHNVVGGIGVVEGNGGRLRPGLPWQAVHDGGALAHDPLRLSVLVEAPEAAIAAVLERHPGVQALFDNGWLHLFALRHGRLVARYRPGGAWSPIANMRLAA